MSDLYLFQKISNLFVLTNYLGQDLIELEISLNINVQVGLRFDTKSCYLLHFSLLFEVFGRV